MIISSTQITTFHDELVSKAGLGKDTFLPRTSGIWLFVEVNHRCNCLLWKEEDLARRRNVSDSEIAGNKRAIDGYNQKRNDAIERIDEELLQAFERAGTTPGGPLNSETAGAIVDRLSILSLKIYHMGLQVQRTDVDTAHTSTCAAKTARLAEQRCDLAACLDALLGDFAVGRRHFKVYRQFKMYNDPNLNPFLYGEATANY